MREGERLLSNVEELTLEPLGENGVTVTVLFSYNDGLVTKQYHEQITAASRVADVEVVER
mgnify:FL=1